MFNPDLNPYVSKMDEHRDIIKTPPIEDNKELFEFVNRQRKLIADLGCGAGNFLRDFALLNPDCDFLGFELRFKRLVKGAQKFKKRDLDNIRLIQARAEDIDLWLPEKSVHQIHINFPDPWPKKRHHKHRLMKEAFLEKARKVLADNGNLVFKTDHQSYYESVLELLSSSSLFEVVEKTDDLHRSQYNEANILTEFESLFKGKGFPVYYLKTNVQ